MVDAYLVRYYVRYTSIPIPIGTHMCLLDVGILHKGSMNADAEMPVCENNLFKYLNFT